MRGCKKFNKDLVAFLYEELREAEKKLLISHLDSCPQCREELERLRETLKGADSLKQNIEATLDSVDWKSFPSEISESIFKREGLFSRKSWFERLARFFLQPKLKPVYAGLLIGILLGSLATFLILNPNQQKLMKADKFSAPKDFLERMELEMARRETLDYLEKSGYLLLDFVQSSSVKSAEFWRSEYTSHRVRDLLLKKRYVNQQFNKFQMAKAKEICDQIEFLFFELTQISDRLSEEQVKDLQDRIEKNQLLLKIKLLKRDLEESEV